MTITIVSANISVAVFKVDVGPLQKVLCRACSGCEMNSMTLICGSEELVSLTEFILFRHVYNQSPKNAPVNFTKAICTYVTTQEPLNVFSMHLDLLKYVDTPNCLFKLDSNNRALA